MATGVENEPGEVSASSEDQKGVLIQVLGFHQKFVQVELKDATDRFNQLIFEREWLLHSKDTGDLKLKGNLFYVENLQSEEGRIFVKGAPLPHVREYFGGEFDITVNSRRNPDRYEFLLHQTGPKGLETWDVLDYKGGRLGRIKALHQWQQSQRPKLPCHQTPRFLSNTWGDRNRDACITHDFILKEIEAGARLGVDVIQIDDGWQKGRTANSAEADEKGGVWSGFWAANSEFWTPDPERFPEGLEPLVAKAEESGLEIGLWYAPDSYEEFSNWKKDAEQILMLHKTYRVTHFKLDSIVAPTIKSRAQLRQMIEMVVTGSDGKIVCDLDITAGRRPGYFGEMTLGPLFLENRYTDWHSYWPHFTLRNLWQLSHYIDPRRLRMEFLNNTRNLKKYEEDPLAPELYPPSTLFATTMMANPLGWFECSALPEPFIEEVSSLVSVWRDRREELFKGQIIPIGSAPNGFSWTGFLSVAEDGGCSYALVFNEKSTKPKESFELPQCYSSAKSLFGKGSVEINSDVLTVGIDHPFGFLFLELN